MAVILTVLLSGLCTYALARHFELNSDEVQSFLAAQSVLSGNMLLTGWHLSVDNFVLDDTLPLALLEGLFGRHISVLPIFAGCTQVALLAAALSASLDRSTIAGDRVIVLITLLGLLGVPPAGTYLPLLLPGLHGSGMIVSLIALLMLDGAARAPDRGRRGTLAALFGLCAWLAIASDPFTLIYAFAPAALVLGYACLSQERAALPAMMLVSIATVAAAGMATPKLIAALGGFHLEPTLTFGFVPPDQLWRNAEGLVFDGLDATGGNVFGGDIRDPATIFHGVRLAMWLGGLAAIRSGLRARRATGLLDRFLAAGCAVLAASCLTSRMFAAAVTDAPAGPNEGTRYVTPLLVFGAILAARAMPAAIRAMPTRRLRAAARFGLVVVTAGLLAGRAFTAVLWARSPAWTVDNPQAALGRFLLSRGLTCGVAEYWDASIITALTDGRVKVRAIAGDPSGPLRPFQWLADDAWYTDMARPHFALWRTGHEDWLHVTPATLHATYGDPIRTEEADGFTIATYANPTCK